jgi:hypothetical protein
VKAALFFPFMGILQSLLLIFTVMAGFIALSVLFGG